MSPLWAVIASSPYRRSGARALAVSRGNL